VSKVYNLNSELLLPNNLVSQLPSTGGRSKYNISIEPVCLMRREGFSWVAIAIIGINSKTIKRRLMDNNVAELSPLLIYQISKKKKKKYLTF
jgi:hypothetical protein